jgi:hypothetical protein
MSPARNTPSPRSTAGLSCHRLIRADRHLGLDQLFAVRRQRRIGRGEALDPACLVEVGHDERVAAAGSEAEVKADGVTALPHEPVVCEEVPGVSEFGGDDHRRIR